MLRTITCGGKRIVPTKILCVGSNYPQHAREMGSPVPAEPIIFLKPNSAIAFGAPSLFIPEDFGLLHHEVELCFVVGRAGKDIAEARAPEHIGGFGVGIDFTLRDRQAEAKRMGRPWNLAKGFDGAAAFGPFLPAREVENPQELVISLSMGGEIRQRGNTQEMIFSPERILSFVSRFMTLEEGDLFMTGTPSGVGEVRHGDFIRAEIEGLPLLELTVLRRG